MALTTTQKKTIASIGIGIAGWHVLSMFFTTMPKPTLLSHPVTVVGAGILCGYAIYLFWYEI